MESVICNNLRKMTAWLYFTTSRFTPSVENFMIVMLMRFFGLYFSHLRLHSFHYSLTLLASKTLQSSNVSHFAGQIVLIVSAAPDVFLQEFGLLHLTHHISLGLLFVPTLRLADNLHQSVAHLPGHVRGTTNVKCSALLQ
jgi:hypothetical protein